MLVVTDGEPTAHLLPGGRPYFAWPPEPETLEATVVEVDRMTRRGATLNVFQLDDDPRLTGSCRTSPGATAAGCCCPTRDGSGSTS